MNHFSYYVPHVIALGFGAAGLYALTAGLRARRRDRALSRFALSTAALVLAALVSAGGLCWREMRFWQTQTLDYLAPLEGWELARAWAAFIVLLALAVLGFALLVRRRGFWRVSTALLRVSFLSLIPTTFLFFDSFIATSQLVYKETVSVVLIGMMAFFWALRALGSGRFRLLLTPYNYPVLLLWAAAGLTLAWTPSRYLTLLNFVYLSAYLAMFFMIAPELKDRRYLRVGMGVFLCTLVVVAAGSVSQMLQFYWGGLLFAPEPANVRAALGSTIGHNNAVSEVMMIGVIFVLGLALLTRAPRRPLWVILATLFLLVIVAATTRGVWLSLPLAVAYFVRYAQTGFGTPAAPVPWRRRAGRWVFAGVLAAFILSGVVVVVNHVARRPGATHAMVPLMTRLSEFSYEMNVRGTRPRLWTIAVVMIADQVSLSRDEFGQPPFLGQGLSAFKWRYPIYQARFFKEHPKTLVWPTHLHADRMHNEYLQPIVELGVPGAVFVIWFLLAHARFCRMVRALRPERGRRVLQITFAAALVAGLLHMIVNFSFHVAPLAVLLIFNFAAFAALGPTRVREWRFAGARDNPTLFAAGMVLSAFVCGWLLLFTVRVVYAEFYLHLGRVYRDAAINAAQSGSARDREQAPLLARGWKEALGRGLAHVPGEYHINLEMAQCYMFLFDLDKTNVQVDLLLSALTHVNRGMQEYQHKSVYFTRGLLLRDLAQLAATRRLTPTPRISKSDVDYLRERALADAERDLRLASDMFPVEYAEPVTDEDLRPLHELGKLYYVQGRHKEAFAAWRRIQARRPTYAEDFHLAAAREAQQAGAIHEAGVSYHIARELAPRNPDIWSAYLNCYLSIPGQGERALELATEFMQAFPTSVAAFAQLSYTAHVTGKPERVFNLATQYLATVGAQPANIDEIIIFGGVLYNYARWDLLARWLDAVEVRSREPRLVLFVENFRMAAAVQEGSWARAAALAEGVLARRPGDPTAISVLRGSLFFLALPVVMGADIRPLSEVVAEP
ncbi:hypothetical protein HS125_12170 [bacterium]|nr:hypothetical protein [bacterium]